MPEARVLAPGASRAKEILIFWHLGTSLAAKLAAWHHHPRPPIPHIQGNIDILAPAVLLCSCIGDWGYQNIDILVALAP